MEALVRSFIDKVVDKEVIIHCIGDAIIDEYYQVEVNRISPENPVPVMLCKNQVVTKPGGAANVAYQFENTNADVKLISYGNNETKNVFSKESFEFVFCPSEAKLPIKKRFMQNNFQVAPRLDVEFPNYNLNSEQIHKNHQFIQNYVYSCRLPNVVIFSDYNKGFFNNEINYIKLYKNVITVVDPKGADLTKWKNCTVFKPNAKEAFELSGLKDWKEQCLFFKNLINCHSVVITDAGNGIKGIEGNDFFTYNFDSHCDLVNSVIGAGDCFAAFLALALAHNFSVQESSIIAYQAGLIYVRQKLNRPIVLAELILNKIVKPADLSKRDFKLAFTNGCFDILHKGHIETLKYAKSKADKLIVALNSDESIKKLKGPTRPVLPYEHRAKVLSSLEFVDFVVKFDEPTPIELIKIIKPEVLVKGGDYNSENVVGKEFVNEVCIAPFIENYSSSNFIKTMGGHWNLVFDPIKDYQI